jgi:hypothetical protein
MLFAARPAPGGFPSVGVEKCDCKTRILWVLNMDLPGAFWDRYSRDHFKI